MALGPISAPSIQPTPPARDVSAAQKAFFQAALGAVQASPQPAAAPATPVAARADEAPDPMRTYRPGKLLDITV
jgi:hypothetical protein